jgi:hypothetical protein
MHPHRTVKQNGAFKSWRCKNDRFLLFIDSKNSGLLGLSAQ